MYNNTLHYNHYFSIPDALYAEVTVLLALITRWTVCLCNYMHKLTSEGLPARIAHCQLLALVL